MGEDGRGSLCSGRRVGHLLAIDGVGIANHAPSAPKPIKISSSIVVVVVKVVVLVVVKVVVVVAVKVVVVVTELVVKVVT